MFFSPQIQRISRADGRLLLLPCRLSSLRAHINGGSQPAPAQPVRLDVRLAAQDRHGGQGRVRGALPHARAGRGRQRPGVWEDQAREGDPAPGGDALRRRPHQQRHGHPAWAHHRDARPGYLLRRHVRPGAVHGLHQGTALLNGRRGVVLRGPQAAYLQTHASSGRSDRRGVQPCVHHGGQYPQTV